MKCNEVKEVMLIDYIDGNTDASVKKIVEAHLSECEGCRTILNNIMESKKMLREFKKLEPSDKVWIRIKREIENKKQKSLSGHIFKQLRIFKLAGAFAFLLLIAFVTYITLNKEARKREIISLFIQNQIETYVVLSSGEFDPYDYEYLYNDFSEND